MQPKTRFQLLAAGAATLIWASSAPALAQGLAQGQGAAALHPATEQGLWTTSAVPIDAPTAVAIPAPTPTSTPIAGGDTRRSLQALLAQRPKGDELAAFYHARKDRPLWVEARGLRPEARRFAEILAGEADPAAERARAAADAAASGEPAALARAEIALSEALASRPGLSQSEHEDEGLAFVDPDLARRWGGGRAALEAAAAAPSLARFLDERASRSNPIYRKLAEGLERYRASWGALPDVKIAPGPELRPGAKGARVRALRQRLGLPEGGGAYDAALAQAVEAFQRAHGLAVNGHVDAATREALNAGPWRYEQQILANIERAKALPPTFGDRYILVDAAAGEMWFYDHGEVAKSMNVVVGKPEMPTPMMAGLVRYAVFNPYWNVPEDLVRTSIAAKVLKQGLGYLQAENMEVLSDYTENAVVLDPATVDWAGVAAGTVTVRVRQKPGPKNMMGQVKLAFPNPLGIYLHDTPLKELFGLEHRTASSGCVRLQDAMSLAALLVGEQRAHELVAAGVTENQVALAEPVPVYITYLTAAPQDDGFVFRPDVYGRDKAWTSRMTAQAASGSSTGL